MVSPRTTCTALQCAHHRQLPHPGQHHHQHHAQQQSSSTTSRHSGQLHCRWQVFSSKWCIEQTMVTLPQLWTGKKRLLQVNSQTGKKHLLQVELSNWQGLPQAELIVASTRNTETCCEIWTLRHSCDETSRISILQIDFDDTLDWLPFLIPGWLQKLYQG